MLWADNWAASNCLALGCIPKELKSIKITAGRVPPRVFLLISEVTLLQKTLVFLYSNKFSQHTFGMRKPWSISKTCCMCHMKFETWDRCLQCLAVISIFTKTARCTSKQASYVGWLQIQKLHRVSVVRTKTLKASIAIKHLSIVFQSGYC